VGVPWTREVRILASSEASGRRIGYRLRGSPTWGRTRRLASAVLFGVLLVPVFSIGVALGDTLTGPTVSWSQPGGWCSLNRPEIAHTRDARSFQRATGTPCLNSYTNPTGSFMVRANMYKNGVWCNATNWYANPSPWSSSSYFGVGSVLCSGSGSFYVGSDNARNIGGTWYYSSRVFGYAHNF